MIKQDFSILIPSNRPILAEETKKFLLPYYSKIYNSNDKSYSKIVNSCINIAENEIIIICNDKARPTYEDVNKTISLLNDGFGIVGLYRFGFFGIKKDLIRKIGFFDERFINGGFEDNDFIARLKEADIAHYMSEEIQYLQIPSSWNYNMRDCPQKTHYFKKWHKVDNLLIRRLKEEEYSYNLGTYKDSKFLDFSKSVMYRYCDDKWLSMKVNTDIKE